MEEEKHNEESLHFDQFLDDLLFGQKSDPEKKEKVKNQSAKITKPVQKKDLEKEEESISEETHDFDQLLDDILFSRKSDPEEKIEGTNRVSTENYSSLSLNFHYVLARTRPTGRLNWVAPARSDYDSDSLRLWLGLRLQSDCGFNSELLKCDTHRP